MGLDLGTIRGYGQNYGGWLLPAVEAFYAGGNGWFLGLFGTLRAW